jgi:hypothetical protein
MPKLDQLTHEYFEQRKEEKFHVSIDDRQLELSVVAVTMLPIPRRKTLTGQLVDVPVQKLPFSVIFRNEGTYGLPQGTYAIAPSDEPTPLNIFMVPLGVEDGGVIYEAVFS